MRVLSHRRLIGSLWITTGIALFTGCQGVSRPVSNAGSALSASSSTLSFGNVQKSKSSNLSETLTNTGGSALTISAANVSSSGFSVSGLSLPMTLPPNQSATFTVTFAPVSGGSVSGTLAVLSSADNSPLNIALSGTEMAPGQLSVSPGSLSFGDVVAGTSSSLDGTLQATGSSVTISAASTGSAEFVLSGISLPATLSNGQTASFTVTFQPAVTGAASARLSFSSDAANSPTAQTLSGNATTAPQHSVDLTWQAAPGSGVVGYNVYRGSEPSGSYSKISSALEGGTTYTDSTVAAGQTYFYVTTAVDGSGNESGFSNHAKAVIPTP